MAQAEGPEEHTVVTAVETEAAEVRPRPMGSAAVEVRADTADPGGMGRFIIQVAAQVAVAAVVVVEMAGWHSMVGRAVGWEFSDKAQTVLPEVGVVHMDNVAAVKETLTITRRKQAVPLVAAVAVAYIRAHHVVAMV